MLIFQTLFGWPAILGSLLISLVGIILGRPKWILIGAMLITGFALYLIALPPATFKLVGLTLPLLHLVAMSLVNRGFSSDVLKFKQEHPEGLVVSYVNTPADIKAVTDI